MAEFELKWKPGNVGSADLVWTFPQEIIEVHTTYVGDGLGAVVQSAVDLQVGSSSAIAFLPAEPGGTCLFFAGSGAQVYLQIVQFADMDSEEHRWSGGKLRWHGRVNVNEYIRQVAFLAEEVLVQYGNAESYAKAWGGFEFPIGKLNILRGSS